MSRQLILWGPPIVSSGPDDPGYPAELARWMERCSNVGITRIIGGDGTRTLTEAAHQVGIEVHPYAACNAFPRHGSAKVTYGWSVDWLRSPVEAPEARNILDRHRPIWDNPKVTTTMSDFARDHPEFRSLTRERSYALRPGEDLYLSLHFPAVRADEADRFLNPLESSGGDGVQVGFVLGNEDEDGAVPYGYEDSVVAAFEKASGKSPFDLANSDPEWLQFRADYVTLFLRELRGKVKERHPGARCSRPR